MMDCLDPNIQQQLLCNLVPVADSGPGESDKAVGALVVLGQIVVLLQKVK
jgi:hypothetical protein